MNFNLSPDDLLDRFWIDLSDLDAIYKAKQIQLSNDDVAEINNLKAWYRSEFRNLTERYLLRKKEYSSIHEIKRKYI